MAIVVGMIHGKMMIKVSTILLIKFFAIQIDSPIDTPNNQVRNAYNIFKKTISDSVANNFTHVNISVLQYHPDCKVRTAFRNFNKQQGTIEILYKMNKGYTINDFTRKEFIKTIKKYEKAYKLLYVYWHT